MPKINLATLESKRLKIEEAALKHFLKNGYNGSSIREVATAADVSVGNIYNHFPDKIALFKAVLNRQEQAFLNPENKVIQYLLHSNFPDDLEELALAIQDNVDRFSDYFKLIYIDVIEFDGYHIQELFSNLNHKFGILMRKKFKSLGKIGRDHSINPSFALTTIYLAFYQYFTLTKLFGAKNIYGPSETKAIKELIRLFQKGIAVNDE